MPTDWQWCYENPREAAAEIDRLADEISHLRVALANIVDDDFTYVDGFVNAGQIRAIHISNGRDALKTRK